jgi:hypothetical protein
MWILSAKQVDLRQVDKFVSAPVENSFQHEQTEALCLLIKDRGGIDNSCRATRISTNAGPSCLRACAIAGFTWSGVSARSPRSPAPSAIHPCIFRTNFRAAVHSCSLPRRRVTKQFICHHVRLKWTLDLPAISCDAPERDCCFLLVKPTQGV